MRDQAVLLSPGESLRQADHRGSEGSRRTLPQPAAYGLAAAVIGLCLFASVVPSPLYHLYAVTWHFSPLTLTLIYATYAFGVLAALLLAGRVSDQIGRRPVLLAALGALMVAWLLFIAARSPAWLFAARGVQGLATGTALSAASAALLDLHPRRDPASAWPTPWPAAPASAWARWPHPPWSRRGRTSGRFRTCCCWSCSARCWPERTGCPSRCRAGRRSG